MRKEENGIYESLIKSEALAKQKQVLSGTLKHPVWYTTRDIPSANEIRSNIYPQCRLKKTPKALYVTNMISVFKKARRHKRIQLFSCPEGRYGFVLPVVQGAKAYGYLLLCNAEKEIEESFLILFELSVENIVKEIQKELELTKLYETIRPRAIALSTIHTIHRLLSSTLDIDELLPRIARLSIQVMRAYRCSIKLLDKKKKTLIPKTTVDLRKNKRINLRKLPVGKGIPGKAVGRSKALRGKGYLSVPLIDEDVIGVITVYDKTNGTPFSQFDQEILTTLAEQAVIAIKNAQMYKEQQEVILGSIKSLATIMNTRTPHLYQSSKFRVRLTLEIGQEMGMTGTELKSLEVASMLHDAGQVSLPDEILTKRTRLTGKEYELVKKHPAKGVEIIEPLKALSPAMPMILHHHENYDGSGYPAGLKGEAIPLGARIMAVAGAFEAMVALRPYRKKTKTIDEAVEEIKKHTNKQFDPKVINAFVKAIDKQDVRKYVKKYLKP